MLVPIIVTLGMSSVEVSSGPWSRC